LRAFAIGVVVAAPAPIPDVRRSAKTDLAFALRLLPIKEIGLRHWVGYLQDFVDLYVLALYA